MLRSSINGSTQKSALYFFIGSIHNPRWQLRGIPGEGVSQMTTLLRKPYIVKVPTYWVKNTPKICTCGLWMAPPIIRIRSSWSNNSYYSTTMSHFYMNQAKVCKRGKEKSCLRFDTFAILNLTKDIPFDRWILAPFWRTDSWFQSFRTNPFDFEYFGKLESNKIVRAERQ